MNENKTGGARFGLELVVGPGDGRATEIRISWKIAEKVGRGLWFANTPKRRAQLDSFVADGNNRYGAGAHWVEQR